MRMSRPQWPATRAALPSLTWFPFHRSPAVLDKEKYMKVFIRMSLVLALAAGLCAQQPAKSATGQPAQKDSGGDQQRTAESFYRLALSLYELDGSKRTNQ